MRLLKAILKAGSVLWLNPRIIHVTKKKHAVLSQALRLLMIQKNDGMLALIHRHS